MPNSDVNKLTPHKDGKRRKMVMTKLTAVALCGRGANPHADVTFFKSEDKLDMNRKDGGCKSSVNKKSMLVSNEEGHSHLIGIGDMEKFRRSGETTWQDDHSHPYVINDDGSITVGMVNSHIHTISENISDIMKLKLTPEQIEELSKTHEPFNGSNHPNAADIGGGQKHKEDTTMPNDKKADNIAANSEVEALKLQLAVATALAELTDTQKSFYNTLNEDGKKDFLSKSPTDRNVAIEVAKNADSVVYKAADGTEYRKSDDPRLVAMAKRMDVDRVALIEAENARQDLELRKRAEEVLRHLPGSVETRMALLKSIDSIDDASQRESALNALKAQNATFTHALRTIGTTETGLITKSRDDAVAEMDRLTKAYMKEHGEPDYYEAYDKVSAIHPETLAKAVAG